MYNKKEVLLPLLIFPTIVLKDDIHVKILVPFLAIGIDDLHEVAGIVAMAFFIFKLNKRFKMFCQKCGEHYNFQEPRCPWCGAPKPVVAVKKKPVKEEPEPKPSTPISKRCVAALVLFVVCIASLSTLASIAFINELLNIPDFDTMYIIAPLYLLGIPLLGVHGYMFDKEQKRSPRNDSKNDIFTMFRTMNDFFYAAPFKYAYHCIKERNYKGLILFAIDISIISFIIAL